MLRRRVRGERAAAISGTIRLPRFGSAASRTLFGIDSQREHVRAGLQDALFAHGIAPVLIEMPADAQLLAGERWDVLATAARGVTVKLTCRVERTWTARLVLRFCGERL